MSSHSKQTGFTLIELAMVLFILTLLLAGFLRPLAERVRQDEINRTEAQMEQIREVIYGYAVKEGRLPCPDCRSDSEGTCTSAEVGDGIEDPSVPGAACKSDVGNLPWQTLGVEERDVWSNLFTYRVTGDFADSTDGTGCAGTATINVSFSLCSVGDITVLDSDGGSNIATGVPAIVVSHGSNWTEVPSSHEAENYDNGTDTDREFVDKDFSEDELLKFDDILIWISPHILVNRMVISGKLP